MAFTTKQVDEGAELAAWHRARRKGVVAIGVIVGIAIVSVVVAVLWSARQADEVALEQERRLFGQALSDHARQALAELEAVVTAPNADLNMRINLDPAWIEARVATRLRATFGHDALFVLDGQQRVVHASGFRSGAADPQTASILAAISDHVQGRGIRPAAGINVPLANSTPARRSIFVNVLDGAPAIIAAIQMTANDAALDSQEHASPIVISAKFIDAESLTEIGTRLQLRSLRIAGEDAPGDDHFLPLVGPGGNQIARFAWTPNRPGAQIVQSVAPFIAVAIGGFSLLAALVLRYMRRTTATISRSEHQLRHLAMHDPLCGLPNRIYFADRLEATMADVANGGEPAAVLYIDLDHFKDVNDTLGHPTGDDLLCAVTLRLSHAVREQELVARLGGDEFAVLTAGSDAAGLQTVAGRLINTLCAPYVINGQNIVIGASIGIAHIDGRIESAADVRRYADMALYRAKNEGRNRACIYDTAMDEDLSHRKFLEADLRVAIEQGELSVAYQPVVNNSGEKILGVEALCRWQHPVLGEIPPAEFIPIAENSGLIVALGEFVLRRACLDGKAWPGITVAVNVSPLQFRRSDFVDVVEQILSETGFDAALLELEVTESTLLGNLDSAELSMRRLKALGARLALDDFGTGYSSLLYLRRFPFDKLKIDRSFVHNIEKAHDAAAIVHAVIGLGRGLGMKVTAEGVETAEQHLFLRAAGIHSLQGYRFGRPGPAEAITARLAHPESFKVVDPGFAMTG